MAIITVQCKSELWLIYYAGHNQDSDLRSAKLPGCFLAPADSTQLSTKIKTQPMS